jgi:hypothetical protein
MAYAVLQFTMDGQLAATKLAVMSLSPIRDALLENGLDTLREACQRPNWRIFSTWPPGLVLPDESLGRADLHRNHPLN